MNGWEFLYLIGCGVSFVMTFSIASEESKKAGILAYYDYDNSQFRRYGGDKYAATWFDNCRPVRRDEVTFYEDRKDD